MKTRQRRLQTMNSSYRCFSLFGCVAFLLFTHPVSSADEVPSESQLPSEAELPGGTSPVIKRIALPPESEIPGETGPVVGRDAERVLAQATNEDLPGENVLPAPLANPPRQADVNDVDGKDAELPHKDAELPHKDALDRRPWLSLRTQAPLGMTRSLVFTPDSQRLCVGGDDKSVLVYRRFPRPDGELTWGYERTIRWQVQRGPRGRINAMDAASDQLAIAGLSAMGESGNIVLLNAASGQYVTALSKEGHRERVTSLTFTNADATGLASMDVTGTLLHWERNQNNGNWSAKKLAEDRTWKIIENLRAMHPITAIENAVIAPRFIGTSAKPVWEIVAYPISGGAVTPIGTLQHKQMVTALTADRATGWIASADLEGEVYLTVDGRQHRVTGLLPGQFAISLSFRRGSQGERSLIVTSTNATAQQGALQVFDISNPALASMRETLPLVGMPLAAVTPDGQRIASAHGANVIIRQASNPRSEVAAFRSSIPETIGVAFSADQGEPRIAITSKVKNAARVKIFEPKQLRLSSLPRNKPSLSPNQWSSPTRAQQGWKIETRRPVGQQNGRPQVMLTRNGAAVCRIPMIAPYSNTAAYWIPGRDGNPAAVAIGTTGQNNVYVFAISQNGKCQLLREFRGHTGAVTCLGLSADQKYLVSGSIDRTVRIWPLNAQEKDRDGQWDRWGAKFLVRDDQLLVTTVDAAGPLYLRGIRAGDVITRLRIPRFVGNVVQVDDVVGNNAMLRTLDTHPADRLLGFEYLRGRTPQTPFQVFSAWPPLASLFVSADEEWAYWTPFGYYDASFEGHRMFGWQVNRGVARAPDFYLAEQVRKSLERPELMSNLLTAGNIEDAFRGAGIHVPASAHVALQDRLRMAPAVQILSPPDGAVNNKDSIAVKVSITVPVGQSIVPPKLFANGVVAGARRLLSEAIDDGNVSQIYQWQASIPSEQEVVLQAIAATESEVVGRDSVVVANRFKAQRKPRLYVAAAAVGDYEDSQIPRLEAVLEDTKRLLSAFTTQTDHVYQPIDLPFFENVTRTGWNVAMEQLANQMELSARADDLLVILLSGHGVRDEQSNEYYYLPADANFADVMARQYERCISSRDLARFSSISCRKLIILDTCHSGAVRPLQQRQLKSAVRVLQDDMFFTLTASQGDQVAVQSRFANRLHEALRGAADRQTGDNNGTVTVDELGKYVRTMVMADSANDARVQIPMMGPRELVKRVRFPITTVTLRNAAR